MKTDNETDRKIRQFVLQWGQEGMFDKVFDKQLRALINECITANARLQELILTDEEVNAYIDNMNCGDAYKLHIRMFYEWYRNKIQEKCK